jgi:hypothetical protein
MLYIYIYIYIYIYTPHRIFYTVLEFLLLLCCILADACISVNNIFYVNNCSCVQWFCGRYAFAYWLNHKINKKYSISCYRRFDSGTLQVIGYHTDLDQLMVSILASVCKRFRVQSQPPPLVLKIKQDCKVAIRKVGAYIFYEPSSHLDIPNVILLFWGPFVLYVNNINFNIT